MTDGDFEQCLRAAFGWCVLFFALLALSGLMGWEKAYVMLQIPCVVWCGIGLALYTLWIVLYVLKLTRG